MKHTYVFVLNVFVKPGIGKAAVLNAEKVTEMRPIDADTLLKRPIWFCGGWMGDSYAEGYMDALDKVEEVIRSEPTIEMPRWIPCEERLPEKEEKSYLVYLDSGNVCECRWWCLDPVFLNPTDHWRWHFMDRPQFTKVLAWMPLPEPYEGEREDDEID